MRYSSLNARVAGTLLVLATCACAPGGPRAELKVLEDEATACLPHGADGILVLAMEGVQNIGEVDIQVTNVVLRMPVNIELVGATLALNSDPTAFQGASEDPADGTVGQDFPALLVGEEAMVSVTMKHPDPGAVGSADGLRVTIEPVGGGATRTVETPTKILIAPEGQTCEGLD